MVFSHSNETIAKKCSKKIAQRQFQVGSEHNFSGIVFVCIVVFIIFYTNEHNTTEYWLIKN